MKNGCLQLSDTSASTSFNILTSNLCDNVSNLLLVSLILWLTQLVSNIKNLLHLTTKMPQVVDKFLKSSIIWQYISHHATDNDPTHIVQVKGQQHANIINCYQHTAAVRIRKMYIRYESTIIISILHTSLSMIGFQPSSRSFFHCSSCTVSHHQLPIIIVQYWRTQNNWLFTKFSWARHLSLKGLWHLA